MLQPAGKGWHISFPRWKFYRDPFLLALSLVIQVVLGLLLGHAYDQRIFMATGYLVGTGQNPYIAQNLSALFHNSTFQGITSFGYPPPYALLLGLLYRVSYRILPSLPLYNFVLKIPVIAANVCLAYLLANILARLGADGRTTRRAWLFLLFNPFLLLVTVAWGQFDSIVALFAILALVFMSDGKLAGSAFLLALAVSCKPTALPIVLVMFLALLGKPIASIVRYFVVFGIAGLLLIVGPFLIFKWDPTPILQHWNAHFSVGGGLSYMTYWELLKDTYQLPVQWAWLGLAWVPVVGMAVLFMKPGESDLLSLIRNSTALILFFFLARTWVSETNLILVLPMILVLVSVKELDRWTLATAWLLPLLFSFINTSIFQLLFPSLPAQMDRLLAWADINRAARLTARIIVVFPWLIAEIWIVLRCLVKKPVSPDPALTGRLL